MNDDDQREQIDATTRSVIDRKAQRRIHNQRSTGNAVWYGLGTMGVVGWSVAMPAVLGILVGLWLDDNVDVSFSWVLTGLITGVVIGCWTAWHWISSEREKIQARRAEIDQMEDVEEE